MKKYTQFRHIWTQMEPLGTKPAVRYIHSAVVWNEKMYIFAGYNRALNSTYYNDVHEYDPKKNLWTKIETKGSSPTKRRDPSAVIYMDAMIVFGGLKYYKVLIFEGYDVTFHECNDLYMLDLNTMEWSEIQIFPGSYVPEARSEHSAKMWGNQMIVFGGADKNTIYQNDVNKFDFTTSRWMKVACGGELPPPRSSHSCVIYNDQMIIFGGFGENIRYNDMYSLNLVTNQWKKINSTGGCPTIRAGHTAVTYGFEMFFFGGYDGTKCCNDFWCFNLHTYHWKKIPLKVAPVPRCYHSAVVINNEMLLFGGSVATGVLCNFLDKVTLSVPNIPRLLDKLVCKNFEDTCFEYVEEEQMYKLIRRDSVLSH